MIITSLDPTLLVVFLKCACLAIWQIPQTPRNIMFWPWSFCLLIAMVRYNSMIDLQLRVKFCLSQKKSFDVMIMNTTLDWQRGHFKTVKISLCLGNSIHVSSYCNCLGLCSTISEVVNCCPGWICKHNTNEHDVQRPGWNTLFQNRF